MAGGRLECTIRRSSRARLVRLTIDPQHTAVVTIPSRAARGKGDAERLAESFVAERESWLRRHLERQARQRAALDALGPLRDGGTFLFRGEPHRLRIVAEPAGRRTVVTREGTDEGDELVVRPGAGERRDLAAILEAWLRVRARSAIEREIERHAPALAVEPAAVTVRDTRSRWGSCSRARRLSFSWRLILAPPRRSRPWSSTSWRTCGSSATGRSSGSSSPPGGRIIGAGDAGCGTTRSSCTEPWRPPDPGRSRRWASPVLDARRWA